MVGNCVLWLPGRGVLFLLAALVLGAGAIMPEAIAQKKAAPPRTQEAPRAHAMSTGPAAIGPNITLVIGKSTLLRLDAPIDRISVGNPDIADVTIISPRELYLLGKTFGSTNIILWRKGGQTTVIDVAVNLDAGLLQDKLAQLLPDEKGIRVSA